jgi:hypothetical protein
MPNTIMLYPGHEKCGGSDKDHLHIPFDFSQIALLKHMLQKEDASERR